MGYDASHLFYTQPGWGSFFEQRMGREKIKLVTYAVDEEIYPEVVTDKIYDVGFIGNITDGDGRQPYIDILKENFNCFISSSVPTGTITAELAKCKVVFNHIRYEEINIRFFEALASGAQVVSHSPSLHLFAQENTHYLTYRNPLESVHRINELLADEAKREQMRHDSRQYVLSLHTYKHRVKEIVNFL